MNVPPPTPERPLAIRSTLLRSILLLELDRAAGRSITVAELCERLAARGFTVDGRPSKVVSDALRTELDRGRARRTSRGRYRIGELPRTTRWRCQQRLRAAQQGRVPAFHLAPGPPGREEAIVVERFTRHAQPDRPRRRRVVADSRNGWGSRGPGRGPAQRLARRDRCSGAGSGPHAAGRARDGRDPPV